MCIRKTCAKCGKPTWGGCGQHIEQVLAGVPKAQRCKCPRAAGAISRPAGDAMSAPPDAVGGNGQALLSIALFGGFVYWATQPKEPELRTVYAGMTGTGPMPALEAWRNAPTGIAPRPVVSGSIPVPGAAKGRRRVHDTIVDPPRTNPTKPWVVATIFDRGPSHHYRYQVTGENLNFPVGDRWRHFVWSVPTLDDDQYDLSRAKHVTQVQYARENPRLSKYAGTGIETVANSTWVPYALIGTGLAGLIYALSSKASAATPPSGTGTSGKTPAATTPPATTAPQAPELPLPSPLVQARNITLTYQRVDPAIAIMQAQLTLLGFGPLRHDGVSGTETRTATGEFLMVNRLNTPDGMTAFINRLIARRGTSLVSRPDDPRTVLYAVDDYYRRANSLGT